MQTQETLERVKANWLMECTCSLNRWINERKEPAVERGHSLARMEHYLNAIDSLRSWLADARVQYGP